MGLHDTSAGTPATLRAHAAHDSQAHVTTPPTRFRPMPANEVRCFVVGEDHISCMVCNCKLANTIGEKGLEHHVGGKQHANLVDDYSSPASLEGSLEEVLNLDEAVKASEACRDANQAAKRQRLGEAWAAKKRAKNRGGAPEDAAGGDFHSPTPSHSSGSSAVSTAGTAAPDSGGSWGSLRS